MADQAPPAITEAEAEVMAALWRRGPLSFASLIEEVKTAQPWADATIKTLLNRLMHKGAVRSVKEDGRQRYHPAFDRDAWVRAEVDAFVGRLFDGDRAALSRFLEKTNAA